MPDIFQVVVGLLPTVLAVAIEQCSKEFRESARYRRAVLLGGVLISTLTFIEMAYSRNRAAQDRESAIQETASKTSASVSSTLSKQYAETVDAQNQEIEDLKGKIRSYGKDVRANSAQVRLLWEETQAGKQKREAVITKLKVYVERSKMAYAMCSSVSPPGKGGIRPLECINVINGWERDVQSYVSGSLGEAYEERFIEAGYAHLSDKTNASVDTSLDARTAAEIERPLRGLDAQVATLKQFVRELGG